MDRIRRRDPSRITCCHANASNPLRANRIVSNNNAPNNTSRHWP
jgi:hypothetical protein